MTPQEQHEEIAQLLCDLQIAKDEVQRIERELVRLGYGADGDVHARVSALVRSLSGGEK